MKGMTIITSGMSNKYYFKAGLDVISISIRDSIIQQNRNALGINKP